MFDALPDVAEHFPADTGLDGGATGHHPTRCRENARAETREDFRHVLLAKVDAASGAADALHPGNQTLAVRSVFQEQTQRLGLGGRLLGRALQQLEALDVALVLEDAGDL